MLFTILILGFLAGIRHALEADHVAAVASLATRSSSLKETTRVAAVWGVGHAAALSSMACLLIWLGRALPPGIARALELAAGVMMIALGLDVLRRLRNRRVHFHLHQHGDGRLHLHAHSHPDEVSHDPDPCHDRRHPAHHHHHQEHHHPHSKPLLARALLVGSVHGLAGSGAIIILALQGVRSVGLAFAYLAVFGLGSILGMVMFSLVVSLPLSISSRQLGRASGGVETVLGLATVAMGIWMLILGGVPFAPIQSRIH